MRRPPASQLPGKTLAAALLFSSLLLALAGCTRTVASRSAFQSGASGNLTVGHLRVVEDQRQLMEPPDRFEPGGRLVATFGGAAYVGCNIWDAQTGGYVGQFPHERCDWPRGLSLSGERFDAVMVEANTKDLDTTEQEQVSTDGKLSAAFRGSEITFRRVGQRPMGQYTAQCKGTCPPISAVAWAPGGRQLAFAHRGKSRIRVIDVSSGKQVQDFAMLPRDVVLGNLLAFRDDAVVAVGAPFCTRLDKFQECTGHDGLSRRAYIFPLAGGAPRIVSLERQPAGNSAVTLDPNGRYLYLADFAAFREKETRVWSLDLRSGQPGAIAGGHRGGASDNAELDQGPSRWVAGLTWETQEAEKRQDGDGYEAYFAWRMSLGKGAVRVQRKRLKGISEHSFRVCKAAAGGAESKSADPPARTACSEQDTDSSGRFRGVAKNAITRVSDGVTLVVSERRCSVTRDGLYATRACGRRLFFRLSSERGRLSAQRIKKRGVEGIDNPADPLKISVLRGDQLPLFLRPTLVTDFLTGKSLLPPSSKQSLDIPPDLLLVRDDSEADSRTRQLVLDARDNGGGVNTTLRAFQGERELQIDAHLTGAGSQSVTLKFPGQVCGNVALYACSRSGQTCSMPVELPHCPKS